MTLTAATQSRPQILNTLLPTLPSSTSTHYRITSHCKINLAVQSALLAFSSHSPTSTTAHILHSLPPHVHPELPAEGPDPRQWRYGDSNVPKAEHNAQGGPTGGASAIPKLVSVVEIIKRSWLDPFVPDVSSSKKGKEKAMDQASGGKEVEDAPKGPKRRGLHQYTFVGALEEYGLSEDVKVGKEGEGGEGEGEGEKEEKRREKVAMEWLTGGGNGKKRPRMKHTPFMVVVLSLAAIPELAGLKGFTHQPPSNARPPKKRPAPEAPSPAAVVAASDAMAVDAPEPPSAEPTQATESGPTSKKKRIRRRKSRKGAKESKEGETKDGEEVEKGGEAEMEAEGEAVAVVKT